MKILEESGQSELHDWQTRHAYWLPANAAGTHHQDVNVVDKPIEVMVVELQRPTRLIRRELHLAQECRVARIGA
jgi:hypothetical protein